MCGETREPFVPHVYKGMDWIATSGGRHERRLTRDVSLLRGRGRDQGEGQVYSDTPFFTAVETDKHGLLGHGNWMRARARLLSSSRVSRRANRQNGASPIDRSQGVEKSIHGRRKGNIGDSTDVLGVRAL